MKTKINFRLFKSRKAKRATGCLNPLTGQVINAKDDIVRNIDDIEKYDTVGYFETYDNGRIIQKTGKYKSK